MAVTITDNRTVPVNGGNNAQCDATAGWTGSTSVTLFTAVPSPVESTGCLAMNVSNTNEDAYFTMASGQDWSAGMLLYVWVFPRGEMDTTANGGIGIVLGDGTNRIAFHVAGSDKAGFRHDDGPAVWQCLVIDTAALPTSTTVLAGTLASLNLASITQVGVYFKTLAKSVGNVENMFWDILRYGNDGLTITGGTDGDPGTFEEIATADRGTADGAAHGICRKLAEGVFGLQGPLTFGDDGGSGAHVFRDNKVQIVFEDRGFTRDKYWIKVVGNGTGAGEFKLGDLTGTGDDRNGINGCSLIAPPNGPAYFDASDADIDEVLINGCTFDGFTGGITLSADATNAPNHEFHGNIVRGCGQVDPGRVPSRNCLFTGTAHFKPPLAACIQDDGGAFTDYTTAANNATTADVNLYPATPVAADAAYFGHDAKFTELEVLVSTASTTGTIVWEYYNGSTWSTLTLTSDHTDFSRVGTRIFKFAVPGDWATTTVNSQGPFYYIRARYSTAGTQVIASQCWMFGPADGSALLWNANIDVDFANFTQNTDTENDPHGVEHPIAGTTSYTYVGMKFSGNDFDIDYSAASGTLTIGNDPASDVSTYEITGGGTSVTINTSVDLTVTCKNAAGLALEGIRVRIEETDGTLVSEGTTNASGIFTDTYNYTAPTAVNIIARLKGFKPNRATDTITNPEGINVPLTMIRDPAVNLP